MSYKIEDYYNLPRGESIPCSCDQCGIDFFRTRRELSTCVKLNQTQVYCSKQCSNIGNTKQQSCQCKNCGKTFLKQLNQIKKYPNHFCTGSCAAKFQNKENPRIWSEEEKNKMSETAKKLNFVKSLKGKQRPMNPELWTESECPNCKQLFEHYKTRVAKFCSKKCFHESGTLGGYRENSTIVHRCEHNGQKMDSGSEKLFAQILDSADIKWVKNSKIFFQYIYNDKNKKYYPDFFLPELNLWVEIKGKIYIEAWLPNKIQAVKDAGLKIILIYSHDLRNKESILNLLR